MLHLHPRDRTALSLLLDVGLRASEACALTWPAIDHTAALVHVFQGKGARDRVVPITHELAAALRRDRQPASPGPLYSRHDPQLAIGRQALHKIVRAAGATIGVHLWPHKLRHTYACQCLAAGLSVYDVMLLLGHERIETTVVYLHVQPDELADRVRRALARPVNLTLALEA